jgi:hypothetical protein
MLGIVIANLQGLDNFTIDSGFGSSDQRDVVIDEQVVDGAAALRLAYKRVSGTRIEGNC